MQKELSTGRRRSLGAWFVESVSSKKLYFYCCKHPGCGYKTTRSGHMKRHERTHTKEKPYKCTMCSYTASRSDHLRRHLKIHLKTICASNPTTVDSHPSSFDSATTSPNVSPSPVLSASSSPSSPSFIPIAPTQQPINYIYPYPCPCVYNYPCIDRSACLDSSKWSGFLLSG